MMRTVSYFLLALLLFLVSEFLLVYEGIVKIYFIFFIPVFVSSSFISLIPFLLFLIPFFVAFTRTGSPSYEQFQGNVARETEGHKQRNVSYGGLLMVGPVPVIFGKGISPKILITLVALAVVLIIIWLIFA